MIDFVVNMMNNPTGVALLGFLLIMVPTMGIIILHAANEK